MDLFADVGAQIETQVSKITRRIGLGILSRVVLATPVDTGRARGNWQVDLAAPPAAEIDRLDKGGGATIADGSAEIGRMKGYGRIYLVNNVSYIGELNEGTSSQAPAGFVDAAIDAELAPFL